MNDISEINKELRLKRTKKSTMRWYFIFFVMTFIIFVIAVAKNVINDALLSIPIMIILAFLMIFDREFIHVPPRLIFLVVVAVFVSMISAILGLAWMKSILFVLTGFILSTIGLILTYLMLGKRPGSINEKPILIAIESFSFGLALYTIWLMISHALGLDTAHTFDDVMYDTLLVTIGCLITSFIYFFGKNIILSDIVNEFLEENSIFNINDDVAKDTKEMIQTGESYSLEFKSTIRTNLETGEQDRRMETAVLKTIAAFLNSEGGTLLVGVSDDGNIRGVDIESFSTRDKMNLHITHLISARIGDEFIPFIKFYEIDYGKRDDGFDKIVIRFDCEPTLSPVFVRDPKDKTSEIYFIRSGPSTVELTGIELLRYAENRKKTGKKKYNRAAKYTELKN